MSKVETRPRVPRARSTVSSANEAAEATTALPVITMPPSTGSDPSVLTSADNSEVGIGSATAVADTIRVRYRVPSSNAAFKERSENQMTRLRRGAGTVSIVNYAAQVVEEICTRALWHMDGELIGDGPGPQIAHDYRCWSWSIAKDKPEKTAQILATCREK